MAEMEDMKTRCPTGHNCETYVFGQSFEGRDLKMFKVGRRITSIYEADPIICEQFLTNVRIVADF